MAVTRAQDLTIAKNATAAEFMVGALWQLLSGATGDTPVMDSALRIARTHVREIVELHGFDKGRLMPGSELGENAVAAGSNGHAPQYAEQG